MKTDYVQPNMCVAPSTRRIVPSLITAARAILCLAALICPATLRAQQASGGDELIELRQALRALEARIDALEKQRAGVATNTTAGGPSAAALDSAVPANHMAPLSSVAALPITSGQE